MNPKKPVWASKTVTANLGFPMVLQVGIEIFPSIGPWVASHPQTVVLLLAAMNIAVRHMTGGGLRYGRINKKS